MEFSMQEYWSGLPLPFPGDLPDTEIKPGFHVLHADYWPCGLQIKCWKMLFYVFFIKVNMLFGFLLLRKKQALKWVFHKSYVIESKLSKWGLSVLLWETRTLYDEFWTNCDTTKLMKIANILSQSWHSRKILHLISVTSKINTNKSVSKGRT